MEKRIRWKQRMAAVLAGVVAVSTVPVSALAAPPEAAAATEEDLLANFSFDEATDGGLDGGNAKASGSFSLRDHGTGKALYLDGRQFLDVTAADGGSLLTGKDEITVSYDAKPEKRDKSWTFFAAPNANTQTYLNERYLGIVYAEPDLLRVERYLNPGVRPGNNLEKSVEAVWHHVDLVVTEEDTALYVNGSEVARSESSYLLSHILKDDSILQIGKGNWEGGEYYRGWIDNYRIYDRALSEEEIQEQYQEFETSINPMQEAYNSLTLLNTDNVKGNLPLVREGENGVTVSWTSDNPEVVTDTAGEDSLYDGGVVNRPEPGEDPVTVNLTAKLSLEGYDSMEKTFTVTVQPKPENLDTDYSGGYLWTNFGVSGGYEKVFLGYSENGLDWKRLNKDPFGTAQPILSNETPGGTMGVRDPHLIRSPEGDKYWILGTDDHEEGEGPGLNNWDQANASQNIVVWESDDLVNWSEPRLVYTGLEVAGCVWAPEAIYDEETGDYLVYWASRDKTLINTQDNALRVYVCRTRDFKTLSEPKVWLSEDETTNDVNIIDTSIVKADGKYYRFSTSDWNTVIDVSDTLDTEDVFDVAVDREKSTPKGSWERIVTRSGSSAAGFDGREGFTVYQLPDGKWCAMGDNNGYQAFVTDDLSKGTFTKVNASFDEKFRHGTVLRLSKAEEARVLEAFKDKTDSAEEETEAEEPVLEYNFEQDLNKRVMTDTAKGNQTKDDGTLIGNASVVYDHDRRSNVLSLDGSSGSYGVFPRGFFDERDTMSISMDVKSELDSGNFYTFAYGVNNTKYNFLRIRGKEVRYGITVDSYSHEQEVKTDNGAGKGNWQKVILTVDGTSMKLYVDGVLVSENENTGIHTSDLGRGLFAYLGKSFYDGDNYFKGSFDNIKVYNRVITEDEILSETLETAELLRDITIGTVPQDPANTAGTDNHTAVSSAVDQEKKEITSYVRKNADLHAVPVTFTTLSGDVAIFVDGEAYENGAPLDLSRDRKITLTWGDKKTEEWTIKAPETATNPVLPGQYADPDIDYFDGKYWLYPTTDGLDWNGTIFHAFSSENLVDWTDEGVILDVQDKNPGVNENGVQIASSAWSDGNAWAPSIEKKNGKYYFYYCGNVNSSYIDRCGTGKAIGVAVADSPTGPFTAQEMPIIYPQMCADANIGFRGQVIDPSIFTDDDGTSYLFFGNDGNGCAMAELNDDMVTIKEGTLKKINGMQDFRESVVVIKRNGLYHFTWSCDDTGSPNYHVNYGTAEQLDGNVTFRYTLLQKDEDADMLGTAHQSLLYMPETDTCYMAYHRFYTPLGLYTNGFGSHRETCIQEIQFNEDGLMMPIRPSMESAKAKATVSYEAGEGGSIQGEASQIVYLGDATREVTAVPQKGYEFVSWSDGKKEAVRTDSNVQQDLTFTASFRKKAEPVQTVTVTYTAAEGGRIEGSAVQTIVKGGATTKVTAKANTGYQFAGWSDGVKTPERTDSGVQESKTLTAKFEKIQTSVPTPTPTPEAPQASGVKLNEKKVVMGVGEKVTLKAAVLPAGASQKVTWTSGKKSVVTVSADGRLKGRKPGSAVVTAKTANGKTVKCKVIVRKAPKKLTVKTVNKVLKKGKSFRIKVKFPKKTASYRLTYTSSKKKVAVVSSTGKVTAKRRGKAVITVKTFNGKKARVKLTVK